jgi:putative ABC transport system permease protein
MYLPFFPSFMTNRWIVLRTRSDPADLTPALRAELADLDPHLPLSQVFTAADLYNGAASGRRFRTSLIALFALLALSLIAAGTYGVTAFHVEQRRHEIGLRIALGADRGRVLGDVLKRALRFAAIGIAVGVIGAVATARIAGSLLFAVDPLSAPTLVGACAFLVIVAGAASWLPARRAVRIDPVETMRLE